MARGDGDGRRRRQAGAAGPSYAVTPDGVAGDADFSFVVIGDTGEGDASQHVLRDRYSTSCSRTTVKFVVLSSDVVYPIGAMKDYETKFWLPFKGTRKPVYAIPGNHDWYDALEAFAATFLTPEAARAAMRARIEVDNGHQQHDRRAASRSSSREAARLRREYAVPTQFQRAPFFEIQTDAVRPGRRRHRRGAHGGSRRSWRGSAAALDAARGKFTMAVLGHPFYAGGHDQAARARTSPRCTQLLREHGVAIVMAGDTHDLEYYAEPAAMGRRSDAPLRQRRRRRLPELRHGARVAAAAATRRVGVLPDDGPGQGEDRATDAVVEVAGVVVDDAGSTPGRSRPSGSRPPST